MHIPTHILSGWIVGNALPAKSKFGPRERLFCMLAASLPDMDGIGIAFGEDAYHRFHHIVGHNVFFGVAVALAMAAASGRKVIAFFTYLFCFHLHLLMDFYGSGIGWRIHYLWPLNPRGFKTGDAWPLTSWQNYLSFVVLLAGTIWIARRSKRTPLERIAPRLDARLVGAQFSVIQRSDSDEGS